MNPSQKAPTGILPADEIDALIASGAVSLAESLAEAQVLAEQAKSDKNDIHALLHTGHTWEVG